MSSAKISKERIGQYLKTALQALQENNGQLPSREVMDLVGSKLDLNDYERGTLEKTGNIRWQSILHFYSIDLQKAGWLVKKNGIWYITEEGAAEIKLAPLQLMLKANEAYKVWRKKKQQDIEQESGIQLEKESEIEEAEERVRVADYGQAQDAAKKQISQFIRDLDPYVFQDLVGALLRGMGYYTSFIAPRGKDGGVDIIAYRDPLGVQPPRMKVQVKHRATTKATSQEIQQLTGILNDDDIGIFVSTGGFTPDAINAIRNSKRHMEKIDLDTFIDLWIQYYEKLSDEDKNFMPLRKISFLAPQE